MLSTSFSNCGKILIEVVSCQIVIRIAHPKLYETKSLSSLVLMNTDVWKISKNYTWLHVRRISEECSAEAARGEEIKLVPKMNACTLHYCKSTAA